MSTTVSDFARLRSGWGLSPTTVSPGCFASVMATGIVSVGAHLKGLEALSSAFFWLAVVLYVFFVVLVAWRAARFPDALRDDLHNPKKAFGFFTFVAATNVLATALEGQSHMRIALVLFCVGLLSWLILGYLIPFMAILGAKSGPVITHVNGTWFVWVVAAQSVAVVASGLATGPPDSSPLADFSTGFSLIAVIMWAVGVALYVACAVFMGVRTLLHRMGPEDLDAPFWVTMGALAISVVAGSRILESGPAPILTATELLISGTSALLWAFATWLIPALVAAGIWRHFRHRIPLGYSAGLWSMVFPLGMYSVASTYVGQADSIPAIEWIGQQWYWIGLTVWAIVFCGMVWSFVRSLRSRGAVNQQDEPIPTDARA